MNSSDTNKYFIVDKAYMKMLGEAILYSSIQFSIGSVQMSSTFSVKNFSKDQETLDNASAALAEYMVIGTFWTLGVSMLLYSNYGAMGAILGFICNLLIMIWIYYSYQMAFKNATQKYNLNHPDLF